MARKRTPPKQIKPSSNRSDQIDRGTGRSSGIPSQMLKDESCHEEVNSSVQPSKMPSPFTFYIICTSILTFTASYVFYPELIHFYGASPNRPASLRRIIGGSKRSGNDALHSQRQCGSTQETQNNTKTLDLHRSQESRLFMNENVEKMPNNLSELQDFHLGFYHLSPPSANDRQRRTLSEVYFNRHLNYAHSRENRSEQEPKGPSDSEIVGANIASYINTNVSVSETREYNKVHPKGEVMSKTADLGTVRINNREDNGDKDEAVQLKHKDARIQEELDHIRIESITDKHQQGESESLKKSQLRTKTNPRQSAAYETNSNKSRRKATSETNSNKSRRKATSETKSNKSRRSATSETNSNKSRRKATSETNSNKSRRKATSETKSKKSRRSATSETNSNTSRRSSFNKSSGDKFVTTYQRTFETTKISLDGRRLAPMELLHQKPSDSSVRVYLFDDFLSTQECEGLIRAHDSHVESYNRRSPILCFDSIGTLRKHINDAGKDIAVTSKVFTSGTKCVNSSFSLQLQTWLNGNWSYSTAFYPGESKFSLSLADRIQRTMGLQPANGGKFQITSYPLGKAYKTHTDCVLGGSDDRDRVASVLMYLNDVHDGGETKFPELGIWVKPKRGRAIVWNNMNPSGKCERHSKHAASVVRQGTKYILIRWYYYRSFPGLGQRPSPPPLPAREEDQAMVSCDNYDNGSCRWYDEWTFEHIVDYQKNKANLT